MRLYIIKLPHHFLAQPNIFVCINGIDLTLACNGHKGEIFRHRRNNFRFGHTNSLTEILFSLMTFAILAKGERAFFRCRSQKFVKIRPHIPHYFTIGSTQSPSLISAPAFCTTCSPTFKPDRISAVP